MMSVMQRRMDMVKVIMNWWNKGNITSAINAMSMQNETTITMDVLNATFAKDQRLDLLNYENIAAIMPHATHLVNSRYESHVLCGLRTAMNILKHFGEPMIQIKTTPVARGVDLAREERINKVDNCIEEFFKFSKSKGYLKAASRPGEVYEETMRVKNLLTNLLNKTRAVGGELE
jgi:hypothetical protein